MIGHRTCFTYTYTGKNFINFGIWYVALSDSGKDYSNYSPGAKNDPPPPTQGLSHLSTMCSWIVHMVSCCDQSSFSFIIRLSNHNFFTLRKHAYSNILNILPPKNENFQIKYCDIFLISVKYIVYGYSLELPQ